MIIQHVNTNYLPFNVCFGLAMFYTLAFFTQDSQNAITSPGQGQR